MSGEFNTAVISFEFDAELLNDENFVPKIYYFNEETQLLEELPNQMAEGNIISVETTHFSKYILLNKTEFDKVWESDIKLPDSYSGIDVVFVMDMSWNMVSSDPKKIRSSVAKAFVDKLGENDRAAVGYFDNIGIFYQDFTSDSDLLYSAIEFAPFFGQSSDLSSGMDLAVSWFTKDSYTRTDAYKAVVLLTDGNGDYDTSYTDLAAQNGVTVYTIGLGNEVNSTVLRSIANGTGGKYYFASTANSLNGLYENIEGEIAGSDLDSNNDGISDYYTKLLCEGKLTSGVGTNYFKGMSYEIIQSNSDVDGDGLKNGEELVITSAENGYIYYKIISNPLKRDSDGDGYNDQLELNVYHSNPLQNEVELYRWNQEFISVIDSKGDISYGGNQGWVEILDQNKDYHSFMDKYSYENVIPKFGCGLISGADILLYLSMNNTDYSSTETDFVSFDTDGNVTIDSYINYIKYVNWWDFTANYYFGVLGTCLSNGMSNYFKRNDIPLKVNWCMSREKMIFRMEEMLSKDIPFTLSIGPCDKILNEYNIHKDGVTFYREDNSAIEPYNYLSAEVNKYKDHYVTVTGLLVDNVKDQTVLEISSWGEKYYIDLDEYLEYVDCCSNYLFSNILYIH